MPKLFIHEPYEIKIKEISINFALTVENCKTYFNRMISIKKIDDSPQNNTLLKKGLRLAVIYAHSVLLQCSEQHPAKKGIKT